MFWTKLAAVCGALWLLYCQPGAAAGAAVCGYAAHSAVEQYGARVELAARRQAGRIRARWAR